ncbi:MAG: hypothetical protein FWF22_05115 [Treponema sp.]|nr:hypothetical protein [Treponema sp.]
MKTVNEKLEQWAVNKIESEFREDVCLLLRHKTLRLDKDSEVTGLESYVPNTSRSNGLARTFIINGIGYDLFPQTWERLEKMADIDHYNLTCLNDAEIIWAQKEIYRQRFESLQAKLRANLKNPELMLKRAQNWVNSASELFAEMLFEDRVNLVRQNAGYICDILAIAIAYTNGTYFTHGQGGQFQDLQKMKIIPETFIELYEKIIMEKDPETQKKLCRSLLMTVKDHIKKLTPDERPPKRDAAELASWYHELSYTWRRIYHYCETGDAVTAYLWGCMLQEELGQVYKEYNAPDLDILSAYDAKNLRAFAESAAEAERNIIKVIQADGTKLDIYSDIDEFLAKNP